jgi:hypothetical protein
MPGMIVGSWVEYEVTVTRSDKKKSESFVEKYTVTTLDGDACTILKEVEGKDPETINGSLRFGSCIFDIDHMFKTGSENMTTVFGHMYVNIFETDRLGGGERIFLGKDNIVFRDVRTQMWSMGVLYTETRELVWTSLKL